MSAKTRRPPGMTPWSARVTVRGRPGELNAAADDLLSRLTCRGWDLVDEDHGTSPQRAVRLERGAEWVALTVAPASARRPLLPQQYEIAASGLVGDPDGLDEQFAAMPFTGLEIELLARDMPLTASTRANARRWLPSLPRSRAAAPLEGFGAIFTIHHQTDFLVLLSEALELGLDRSLVTVIDKEYNYRLSRRVDAHVRERLGVPVFTYSNLEDGLKDHIKRVADARGDAQTWTPTVIVDDGGYVLPVLRNKFPAFLSLFRGVVEQTKSGIWALRPFIDDVKLPIFSVAESDLKSTVEAQGVAMAALTSLRRLLPNEKFDGRPAVVVGFGVIGEALAELLKRHNFTVWVTDAKPAQVVAARERGFNVEPSLPKAIDRARPSYVFSCAEPGAVGAEAFVRVRDDCCLVSLTSRDRAFDKQALADRYRAEPCGNLGTRYVNDDRGVSMLLIADGFPVNFHFAESMPNQQSDLVMASLLVGAMALAAPATLWPPGNDSARANAVLNEGTLLGDFLERRPSFAAFCET